MEYRDEFPLGISNLRLRQLMPDSGLTLLSTIICLSLWLPFVLEWTFRYNAEIELFEIVMATLKLSKAITREAFSEPIF